MLSKNQIRFLQSLRMGKFRDQNRLFIAEGSKLADELLKSEFIIRSLFATGSWIESHREKLKTGMYPVQEITEEELKKVSSLTTPNEVLAVVEYPSKEMQELEVMGDLVIVLDRIQDPGNLGTIIRTADWFGIREIICSVDSADVFNPKVVQATMGSVFRINVYYADIVNLLEKFGHSRIFYGTSATGENIYSAELKFPSAVIFGNESRGISSEIRKMLTTTITIPSVSPGAESLNAAVAAGIIISEFRRRGLESL
jgi:TrmH family RNA methyltransferase